MAPLGQLFGGGGRGGRPVGLRQQARNPVARNDPTARLGSGRPDVRPSRSSQSNASLRPKSTHSARKSTDRLRLTPSHETRRSIEGEPRRNASAGGGGAGLGRKLGGRSNRSRPTGFRACCWRPRPAPPPPPPQRGPRGAANPPGGRPRGN